MAVRASRSERKSRRVETAVRRVANRPGRHLVLAVSGGRDSMALLHAFARVAPKSVAIVATFDHATGPAATKAAELVSRVATELGFPVVVGPSKTTGTSEAEWREARREFLTDVAHRMGAAIATAHTRDDQLETVLIRVLRDSGARGLAGLYASGKIVRPFLDRSRHEVAAYARNVGATWIDDPTNDSMRFLRNRVRRDLLPALGRVSAPLEKQLLDVARHAARWREELDRRVAKIVRVGANGQSVSAAVVDLAGYAAAQSGTLWQSIAARVGLAMDWRGTERAAAFTHESRVGARIPLSGGWEISRTHDRFELARVDRGSLQASACPLAPGIRWDGFTFVSTQSAAAVSNAWVALLPANVPLTVRRWQPGDRMQFGDRGERKVKRFLSDARVSGAKRGHWPVVLAGDKIVWIPGVRRSEAASVRPGRPGVLYRCELEDR